MFRLIAIALTSTFALLGLFGAGTETLPLQRAGVAGLPVELRNPPEIGVFPVRYVAVPELPLRTQPRGRTEVIDWLASGTQVRLIDVKSQGFVRVRDGSGRVGYLPAEALSAREPG